MSKNRWSILAEDDSILVINKQDYREEIFMVHRLDRDTSGVMVLAKNQEAHKFLNEQFENRKVEKIYHAFVDGCPIDETFTIDEAIALSSTKPGQVFINKLGKQSSSSFKILERWKGFSLLECRPHTGRLHQIRIHLQHAGHALMIDPKYGSRTAFKISEIKRKKFNIKKNTVERPLISRQTLHARSLSFIHPATKEKVTFECEYPKDLRALKNQLTKWNAL